MTTGTASLISTKKKIDSSGTTFELISPRNTIQAVNQTLHLTTHGANQPENL